MISIISHRCLNESLANLNESIRKERKYQSTDPNGPLNLVNTDGTKPTSVLSAEDIILNEDHINKHRD